MSYKDEKEAIWKWYEQKSREYLEAPIEKGYLDSDLGAIHQEDFAEYKHRLDVLDTKYGVK